MIGVKGGERISPYDSSAIKFFQKLVLIGSIILKEENSDIKRYGVIKH